MIEIFADGNLYIADYFMPKFGSEQIIVRIAKPPKSIRYVGNPPDTSAKDCFWEFEKVRNGSGDIRWKLIGDLSETGAVVNYFTEKWRAYENNIRRNCIR